MAHIDAQTARAQTVDAAELTAAVHILVGFIAETAANTYINTAAARVTGSPQHHMIRPRWSPPPHCMRKVRKSSSVEHTARGVTFDNRLNQAPDQPRVLRIRKRA